MLCWRKRTRKFWSAIQPQLRPEVANVEERPCEKSDDFGKRGEKAAGADVEIKEGMDSTASGDCSFDERFCSSGTELSIVVQIMVVVVVRMDDYGDYSDDAQIKKTLK